MNRTHGRPPRWGSLSLFLGLWLGMGVGLSTFAGEPVESARSTSTDVEADRKPVQPLDVADSKVHGTITVDFEQVTIAELLKLVSVVEKVDGVIHIVSSKDQDGQSSIVVTGSQGGLALSRPQTPNAPNLVIASANATTRHPASRVADAPPMSRRAKMEFPRLAAIGRLLGVGGPHEDPDPLRVSANSPNAQRVTSASALVRREGKSSLQQTPDSSAQSMGDDLSLSAGSRINELASGATPILGAFHSPWPAPGPESHAFRPDRDSQVSRAVHISQDAVKSAPQRHVAADGETFEALAGRYYGDSRYAWALWWANRDRVAWPDALTPGKLILVPGLGDLDPKMVMAQSPNAVVLPRLERTEPPRDPEVDHASYVEKQSSTAPEASPAGGFAVHVVRPEDTLRIIAREKCGDERKALDIIALNQNVLTPEGRARVGQRLILPAPVASPAP
ncbi:LysM peptidoglycan-binding domain-containing protein [Planctomyces sp. SH-PL62]|uniref:LysM peptidoglycan-binding domain-containing protein n=1 Tax=Planctomyces sp. SH-PL62 TaxID=1636152 RepID=UPI00078E20FA|nr:LysM peptidoglycan-binding domain-containing protein [Planctomyces sp. SH-PL62]AMV39132.1 LysM domain/BON superfamily protein [Planctomyces sp. SH-PL62]